MTAAAARKRIPVSQAERLGRKYGYDQIVILGRRAGDDGGWAKATWGTDREHCRVAALIGDAFQLLEEGKVRLQPIEPLPGEVDDDRRPVHRPQGQAPAPEQTPRGQTPATQEDLAKAWKGDPS